MFQNTEFKANFSITVSRKFQPVQKSQPKAFEVCTKESFNQCKNLNQRYLRYARRFKSTNQRITTVGSSKPQPYPAQGCLFGRDTLIGGFESTRIPQMPLVEIFAPVMLRKLVSHLQDCFSREILEGLSSHSDGAWIHIILVDQELVFSR